VWDWSDCTVRRISTCVKYCCSQFTNLLLAQVVDVVRRQRMLADEWGSDREVVCLSRRIVVRREIAYQIFKQ
jgi:hypothetical protein